MAHKWRRSLLPSEPMDATELKALMEELDVSPLVLAAEIGVATQTVYRWLGGGKIPTPEAIAVRTLAKAARDQAAAN